MPCDLYDCLEVNNLWLIKNTHTQKPQNKVKQKKEEEKKNEQKTKQTPTAIVFDNVMDLLIYPVLKMNFMILMAFVSVPE